VTPAAATNAQPAAPPTAARPRRLRSRVSLFAEGEPLVWLTGGGLVIAILMIASLLALVVRQGIATLWPVPVVQVTLTDGTRVMGEITRAEWYRPSAEALATLPPDKAERARAEMAAHAGQVQRRLWRIGNFELTGEHFRWVTGLQVTHEECPEWALVLERTTWGRFYGIPTAFTVDGQRATDSPAETWAMFRAHHGAVASRRERRRRLETHEIGAVNAEQEAARLAIRAAELRHGAGSAEQRARLADYAAAASRLEQAFASITTEIAALNAENARYGMVLQTADGRESTIDVGAIVRAYPANRLGLLDKIGLYLERWGEFLLAEPREANSEGGVFPAIFGTVVMTLIMSLAVVPLGVMAALYLREYAKAGPLTSAVRIAINNLAGVPSIVFGVFGLGFFCYFIGASIDSLLFAERLPNPTYGKGGVLWAALTLALLALPVVIVATEEALSAVPNSVREGSYACGASKWQTIRRIVLPRALPGILTGTILAMARGAGEVAPLMLVGAVKLAPELPIDGTFPFLHPERSFMHLGFHIYDLGFQSQNSEAAKPMVFTTTLLLIGIIFLLNLLAVRLRARLRRRFVSAAF
jgi:phosphate transport system permease protein